MSMYAEPTREELLQKYQIYITKARMHQHMYPELKKKTRELWAKVEELKNQLGEEEFK